MTTNKPKHLPQINASYNEILEALDGMGVKYSKENVSPETLKPTYKIFVLDGNVIPNTPIWVSEDYQILDGNKRWYDNTQNQKLIVCVRILDDFNNSCRILNKVSDIYEYKNTIELEKMNNFDFLDEIEISEENDSLVGNKKTIVAYRKEPINEKSISGNFFSINPVEGFVKYEIDFDNLLELDKLGVIYLNGQSPIDTLSKFWFPNINFDEIAKKYNVSVDDLKCKSIFEKALKMKIDGIKYNDKLLQGIK